MDVLYPKISMSHFLNMVEAKMLVNNVEVVLNDEDAGLYVECYAANKKEETDNIWAEYNASMEKKKEEISFNLIDHLKIGNKLTGELGFEFFRKSKIGGKKIKDVYWANEWAAKVNREIARNEEMKNAAIINKKQELNINCGQRGQSNSTFTDLTLKPQPKLCIAGSFFNLVDSLDIDKST